MKTKAKKKGGWSREQAVYAARALRSELGEAWLYMVPATKEAFASRVTLSFVVAVAGSDRGAFVDPDWVVALHEDIRTALDLVVPQ